MKRLVCSDHATIRFLGGTPLRTSSRAVIRQGSVADMQKSVS